MQLIRTNQEIKSELSKNGYSIVPANQIQYSEKIKPEMEAFISDWSKLELDQHMMDGGKYRLRRYGRFSYNRETGKLTFQGDVEYFQSADLNPLNGGQQRRFAPLLEETLKNQFLLELIKFDFSQLPLDGRFEHDNWNVGVHQIRIIAEPGKQGLPAPEGIHKDGEMFTVQHLIERNNIKGGANSVYDNDKQLIHTWTQQNDLDAYYFEDDVIYHSVTEIVSKNEECIGYRDVLLIDFDPQLE